MYQRTNEVEIRKYRLQLMSDHEEMWLGLVHLYDLQTPEERKTNTTFVLNSRGFDKDDAPILTPLARKAIRRGDLSQDEWSTVRARIGKYAAQLLDEMESEQRQMRNEWFAADLATW